MQSQMAFRRQDELRRFLNEQLCHDYSMNRTNTWGCGASTVEKQISPSSDSLYVKGITVSVESEIVASTAIPVEVPSKKQKTQESAGPNRPTASKGPGRGPAGRVRGSLGGRGGGLWGRLSGRGPLGVGAVVGPGLLGFQSELKRTSSTMQIQFCRVEDARMIMRACHKFFKNLTTSTGISTVAHFPSGEVPMWWTIQNNVRLKYDSNSLIKPKRTTFHNVEVVEQVRTQIALHHSHRNPFPCAALVSKNRLLGLANFLGGKMDPFS